MYPLRRRPIFGCGVEYGRRKQDDAVAVDILVLQFFGTLFYLLWIRPKLRMYEHGAAL
jgi:hypothetical protein